MEPHLGGTNAPLEQARRIIFRDDGGKSERLGIHDLPQLGPACEPRTAVVIEIGRDPESIVRGADGERRLLLLEAAQLLLDRLEAAVDRLQFRDALIHRALPHRLRFLQLRSSSGDLQRQLGIDELDQRLPALHLASGDRGDVRHETVHLGAHDAVLHRFEHARRAEMLRRRNEFQGGDEHHRRSRAHRERASPASGELRTEREVTDAMIDRPHHP